MVDKFAKRALEMTQEAYVKSLEKFNSFKGKGLKDIRRNELKELYETIGFCLEDAKGLLNLNSDERKYFVNFDGDVLYPLLTANHLLGYVDGEMDGYVSMSKLKTEYAKIRVNKDPKQTALKSIEEEFKASKYPFNVRGYKAKFAKEMWDKYPEIESIDSIERLVSRLYKAHLSS